MNTTAETAATVVTALHLCTTKDTNGNPRRVYVGFDANGHHVRVTDEGYAGRPDWVRALAERGTYAVEIHVTPGEYRRWIKLARSNG